MRTRMESVLKIRDDSYILAPFIANVPTKYPQRWLVGLKCCTFGGVMDATYWFGRASAQSVLTRPIRDWNERRGWPTKNPEMWLANSFKRAFISVYKRGFCSLPFVSIRKICVPQERVVIKSMHYSSILSHSCYENNSLACKTSLQNSMKRFSPCPRNICRT